MTASARKLRTAVARNRVRRRVRESFRHAKQRLAGLDVVVLVREAARDATSAEVFTSLEAHWSRLERAARAGSEARP